MLAGSLLSQRLRSIVLRSLILLPLFALVACAQDVPAFTPVVLDPHIGNVCYAVASADVDGDKQPDVVAVSENRVVWYQNPTWKPRVIIADQTERDNVCIAPHDIDGDGRVDFALGAGWTKIGTIQWLSRGASLDDKWNVHLIGQEVSTHRMRWGDLLGTGKAQLVVSPLNKSVSPAGARLLAFEIPSNPKTDTWKTTVVDEALNRMHNHWMVDLNGDDRIDCLTASEEGLLLFHRQADGTIGRQQIGLPDIPGARGKGNGEVKVGKLKGGRKLVVAVAPFHGNAAVVYTEPVGKTGPWTPQVLTTNLNRGHAVYAADFDGDGNDEFVIGHSDPTTNPGPGISVFRTVDDGKTWTRHVVDDGGIAVEDLVVDDFNGDGKPDIVGGGRATHNVKLYLAK